MKSVDVLSSSSYSEEITKCSEGLRKGYVILFPTDTVWGLGCSVDNKAAYERVAHIKRCENQQGGFVILMNSIAMLREYVPMIHPRVETLLTHYHRPLTIVYKNCVGLKEHLYAADGSIAIRVVNDEFCKGIITTFGQPIVGSLASTRSNHYPLEIEDIEASILEEVDYTVSLPLDKNSERLPSLLATQNKKGELEFIRE